ncbi:hypothetical protein MNBD_NITROSPINAE05-1434 [hydrothermal vent metagenome]|uniref:Leucine Rich repeats (2 copies) n=1 Tax=hydrothermal vent metagenome TaxID=652676 RepID=A0A3B1D614_9ZZZZ
MSRKQFQHFIRLLFVFVFLVVPFAVNAQSIDQKDPLDFEKLFAEGLKRRGKTLDLSGKKIGDEGLKILSQQKWLQKLTKIELRYNDITEEGAKTLALFPTLPKLKVLILRHNFLADNGAVILSQAKNFPNLMEIQLGWNEIRDQGAVAFANTKNFPKLRKLDFRGNFLSGATKSELKKTLAHLKALKLY